MGRPRQSSLPDFKLPARRRKGKLVDEAKSKSRLVQELGEARAEIKELRAALARVRAAVTLPGETLIVETRT